MSDFRVMAVSLAIIALCSAVALLRSFGLLRRRKGE